jgi:hypothetical protein
MICAGVTFGLAALSVDYTITFRTINTGSGRFMGVCASVYVCECDNFVPRAHECKKMVCYAGYKPELCEHILS